MFHSHSDFQLHIIYNQLISSLSLADATRYKTVLLNVCCEAFTLLGRSLESNMKFALGYLDSAGLILMDETPPDFLKSTNHNHISAILGGIFTQEHQLLKGKMPEQ